MITEESRRPVAATEPVNSMRVPPDVIGALVGVFLCLAFCCWFSYGRIFWEDEMLGWLLLHDPSWHHFVSAWKMGADGGGFAFYLLGRAWFRVFGASNLSFRLISACCFALGFCVTWRAARLFYSRTAVGIALYTTWFLCPPMVTHMVEGRFYGLLVLATSLAAWVALAACKMRASGQLCFAAFLANALLTTTHTLGVVYSSCLLAAIVFHDVRQRQSRPFLYASVACSWLLLWPERQAIVASAAVGKPWFWTYPPDAIRFAGAFCGFSDAIAVILLGLIAALLYTIWKGGDRVSTVLNEAYKERLPVYLVAGSLFFVPLLLGVQAHVHGTSLFINRYLLPVNIGLTFMLCELLLLVRWQTIAASLCWLHINRSLSLEAATVFAGLVLLWNVIHVQPFTLGSVDYTDTMTSIMPRGIPVVFEDAWGFTEMIGTQHGSGVDYTYMLDWPQSTSPKAPRLEVTQYHLMENWKKVGYFSGSIQYRDDLLARYPKFLVLKRVGNAIDRNGIIIGNPLVQRFAETPGVQVTRLRKYVFGYSVWLVCTASCS